MEHHKSGGHLKIVVGNFGRRLGRWKDPQELPVRVLSLRQKHLSKAPVPLKMVGAWKTRVVDPQRMWGKANPSRSFRMGPPLTPYQQC